MPFGSRSQRKRNRDDRSAREAENKRPNEEEKQRKQIADAAQAEREEFVASNSELPDEARLTKAVKLAVEESKKPANIRMSDKEIMELYTVKKTSFYRVKGTAQINLEQAVRSEFYSVEAAVANPKDSELRQNCVVFIGLIFGIRKISKCDFNMEKKPAFAKS